MNRNILVFGLLSGALVTGMALYAVTMCYNDPKGFEPNDVLGYLLMILAFSFIFVGVKRYRDQEGEGFITFWKAFKIGLGITTVASLLYLVSWLVYYPFVPDFIDQYTIHVLHMAEQGGATAEELQATAQSMAEFKEMYKNPFFMMVTTFLEPFPVGLVISLITAGILRRRPKEEETEMPVEAIS